MTYDVFDYEAAIGYIYPGHGVIKGEMPGPVQNQDNFNKYPFEKWIELYNDQIGLFGGIDVNILTQNGYDEVYKIVLKKGNLYWEIAKGYGIGSGHSIAWDA